MGQALLDNLVPNLSRVRWPVDEAATELGRIAYEKGLELVDEFRGQPQKLVAALRTFTSADSRPYAFAGTAYTVMAASRESSGEYAPAGLQTAMEWLEAAQEMAPDIVSINFIEARIYVFEDRLDDARLVLDFLQEQDPNNYHVWTTETLFWEHVGDEEKTIGAYQQAVQAADTVPRRLRLQSRLAGTLRAFGRLDDALEAYKRARHFDRDNARLLHEMSTLALEMGDLDGAERLNQQVLAQGESPAARRVADAIREKREEQGGGNVLGRLFGRR